VLNRATGKLGLVVDSWGVAGCNSPECDQSWDEQEKGKEDVSVEPETDAVGDEKRRDQEHTSQQVVGEAFGARSFSWERSIVDGREAGHLDTTVLVRLEFGRCRCRSLDEVNVLLELSIELFF